MTEALTRIASSSPGRIRVRDPALRNRNRIEAVVQALEAIDAVHDIKMNVAAGSVVLHYDPEMIALDELEHHIDAAVVASAKSGRKTLRRYANRVAKAGMLGSLGASLALVATGNKRWHSVTGGLFVACLAVHLGLQRKTVLR